MSLSDDELARLREIESLTVAQDPRFAAHLDLDRMTRQRRRLQVVCWWLLAVGMVLALLGAGAARGLISLGTMVAAAGCALIVWATVTARGLRPRRK